MRIIILSLIFSTFIVDFSFIYLIFIYFSPDSDRVVPSPVLYSNEEDV